MRDLFLTRLMIYTRRISNLIPFLLIASIFGRRVLGGCRVERCAPGACLKMVAGGCRDGRIIARSKMAIRGGNKKRPQSAPNYPICPAWEDFPGNLQICEFGASAPARLI